MNKMQVRVKRYAIVLQLKC